VAVEGARSRSLRREREPGGDRRRQAGGRALDGRVAGQALRPVRRRRPRRAVATTRSRCARPTSTPRTGWRCCSSPIGEPTPAGNPTASTTSSPGSCDVRRRVRRRDRRSATARRGEF
jgi:hypothetical protein